MNAKGKEEIEWTQRDEHASRAMQAFISNADLYVQLGQYLPTVATTSYLMADEMMVARERPVAKKMPDLIDMAEMAAASGSNTAMQHFETARNELLNWRERALNAEARVRALEHEINGQPYERRKGCEGAEHRAAAAG